MKNKNERQDQGGGRPLALQARAGSLAPARRALALLLAVCMAWSVLPTQGLAASAADGAPAGCTHVHDAACGYAPPQAGVPCDQGCADEDGDGAVDHAPGCAFQPAQPGSPCTHVCGPECGGQPAPDPTPEPGLTPEPSGAPTPGGSPQPGGTPAPTLAPEPGGSPAPSGTPAPSPTPQPSESPAPTLTPQPGVPPQEPGAPQPLAAAGLTDRNEYFLAHRSTLSDEELQELAAPAFENFDLERREGGLLLTGALAGAGSEEIKEYGFVWSFGENEPTLAENDGRAAFTAPEGQAAFEHRIEGREDALARAYLIRGEYVTYSAPLTADNLVENGVLLPVCYRSAAPGAAGETLVYGRGAPFDFPFILVPVSHTGWLPVGAGFYLQVDRAIDPNETVYLVIKGSIAGVPILDVNGKHVGELQSTVNEEYYIIPMQGRDLNEGQNFINIVLPPLIPGWFYIDNIQLVFGGGPGELAGSRAAVEQVAFQGYNFYRQLGGYGLAVDGLVRAENQTGQSRRLVTSVNVDGNKMYSSQKYLTLPQGSQELATANKCTDGILTINQGTLTLSAALVARPPAGSAWAAQDKDEVVLSVKADTIQYQDNDGPNEYRLDFSYDKNYYSPAVSGGPLEVKLTAQSVFGAPVGYICLPKSGAIEQNRLENDPDEGIGYDGRLKTPVLLNPNRPLEKKKWGPYTVEVDMNRRVYATEAAFQVETNGAYTFAVVGPTATEYFTLIVTNIDSRAPQVELIGAAELTLLEDTPYHDLGFGGTDNRTVEAKLALTTLLDGSEADFSGGAALRLAGGEHTISCIARDEAGNEARLERVLHVANRPLELVTEPVQKDSRAVSMAGSIRYLGEEKILQRGLVWDVSSAPTLEANLGKSAASFNVNNRDRFTASASLASLIPNAAYYCRAWAKTESGRVVYGPAQRFEANSKSYGAVDLQALEAAGNPGGRVTLTVRRTGGADGAQTVRWRTVDGSALAGVHYTAAGGTLSFAPGVTSQTVTVQLRPSPTGQYRWELENRVFFVELTSVTGGAALDTARRTCTVTVKDNDSGHIQITNMNNWVVASENIPTDYKKYGGKAFGRRDYMYFPSQSGYDLSAYKYWAEHGRVQGRQQLIINMKSSDSGLYVYVRKNGGSWVERAGHWYDAGDGEKVVQTGALDLTGQDFVMAKGLSQVRVVWSWVEFKNPRLTINFSDTDTPALKQITALSGDYKAGDTVYFTARFSEIVNVTNQAQLYLNVKLQDGQTLRAEYAGGTGTDVLVFRLPVPENVQSEGVTASLQGLTGYVRDLANKAPKAAAGTLLAGVNLSSMPYTVSVSPERGENANSHTVRIQVAKPAGYAGAGEKYQYVFSTSQTLDAAAMSGLKPFASGETVTLAGGSGQFWLHLLIQDSLGLYRTQRGPYEISNGQPVFTPSAPTAWTREPVRVSLAMQDAAYLAENKGQLSIYKLDNTSGQVTAENFDLAAAQQLDLSKTQPGGFWFETAENGSWALLAVDAKSNGRYFSAAAVNCIDTAAPTLELAKDQTSLRVTTGQLADFSYTGADPAVYAYGADAASGLARLQYAFATGEAAPTDPAAWKSFESGDRLSLSGYFGEAAPGSYRLHLQAQDKAGNTALLTHPTPFTVPPKTPPSISVEVRPLPAGRNSAGGAEQAFTAAELTAPQPGRFTARTVTLHVTVRRSDSTEPGADLGPVMLPGNKSLWDNGLGAEGDHASTVYVEGLPVQDQNSEPGVIEFDYPAGANAVYRFMATDQNGNAAPRADGTVVLTAIDRDAPELTYKKLDEHGAALLPQNWVSEAGGVTLRLSFSDLVSPLYGQDDALLGYTGVGGVEYLVLADGESEAGSAYQPYSGEPVEFTTRENGALLVKVRDALGNSYTQRVQITNIDSTPPSVETTNTSYGAGKAPITMQLKFTDREMGLVGVRRYAVLGTTAFPDPASPLWAGYDGGTLSLTEPGVWYVHYYAEDAVGHSAQGCFGPYIIDNGKPVILIESLTSDEWIEQDGRVEFTYRDDKYARMHSAQITVEYPDSMTGAEAAGAKREYQWSQSESPSPFGWAEAPAAAMEGNIARFALQGWGSEGVSGRWYLHLRTKGSTAYRGFLFDNDLPVITLVGDNPVYIPRGEVYSDRGARAADAQDTQVAVTTKLTQGGATADTRYIDTAVPGEHLVHYTATDKAGNTATAQRVVYVYDSQPPQARGFARATPEDTALAFARADFEENYTDDANQPLEDGAGGYRQFCSLSAVSIAGLPAHGALLLGGEPLAQGALLTAAQLEELRYMPAENYFGADGFSYIAYDTGVGERQGNPSQPARVELTVRPVNDPPAAAPLTVDLAEDTPASIDLTPVIGDVEDGAALTVALGSITARPGAATRVSALEGAGTASVEGQTIRYTPAQNFNGMVVIPYTVTDSQGAAAEARVTVVIAAVNDPPALQGVLSVKEQGTDDGLYRGGQQLQAAWPEALDPDNEPVSYTLALEGPQGTNTLLAEKLEGAGHTFTLPAGLNGAYSLRLTALDGQRAASAALVSETFVVDSTPPVVEGIAPAPAEGWKKDQQIELAVTVTDQAHGQPAGAAAPSLEYALDLCTDGKTYAPGPWQALGQQRGFAVSAEGLTRVRVRATDAAGNVSAVAQAGPYRLDRTPPLAFAPRLELGAVANGLTAVTLRGATADDTSARLAVAGLAPSPYAYRLGEGAFTPADGAGAHTFTGLAPNTLYTFTLRAADAAGNLRDQQLKGYTRAQSAQSALLTAWASNQLQVQFAAPQNPRGTEYKLWLTRRYGAEPIGETGWITEAQHTFTGLEENTEYLLYIQVRNGDKRENDPVRFETDSSGEPFKTNQKPLLTLAGPTAPRWHKAGDTLVLTGTVEDPDLAYHGGEAPPTVQVQLGSVKKPAALTPAPLLLGLGESSTKWNWRAEFTVDAELADVPDGRYEPTVTAADNRSEAAEASFTGGVWLDRKAPPAPTAQLQNDQAAEDPLQFSAAAAVLVQLSANGDTPTGTPENENPSGVKALRYKLEGDPAVAGGGQSTGGRFVAAASGEVLRVTGEGHTTLTLQVEDNAGNRTETVKEIYIDRTRPEAPTLTAQAGGQKYDGGWVNQPVTVALAASDAVGVGAVYAKITDSPTQLGENPAEYDTRLTKTFSENALEKSVGVEYSLEAQQQNYLHLLLVDTAGNPRTLTAGPYQVDTAAPAPLFEVPEKELTTTGGSVVLRGHSARVTAYDAGNKQGNAQEGQVSGLAKAEYLWLPERVSVDPATGGFTLQADGRTPPRDDGGDPAASGISAYQWKEFTSGAQLVQGGRIDGSWNLWVRLTDRAGNTACYSQAESGSRSGQISRPAFLFDNEAPNLPQNGAAGVLNSKTYGTLDVELPTDDENYDRSNSGPAEYQYAFTTSAEAPEKGGLPVFKFESYTDFLNFAGGTSLSVPGAAADLRQSTGVTLAAQAVFLPGAGGFHTLLRLADGTGGTLFKVSVSDVTGAIVLTDSAGADKHFGGGYNDGRAHQITVAASFSNSVKVFADGQYLGRFWFPSIQNAGIQTVTLGEGLRGALFAASLFGRVADDAEGKAFSFRTDDILADYVVCSGLAGNLESGLLADRSGQQNAAEVTGEASWTRTYESERFLSGGSGGVKLALNDYLQAYTTAKEITVSTTFRAADTNGVQFLFSSSQGDQNRFYIYLDNGRLHVPFYKNGEQFGTKGDTGLTLTDGRIHTVTATAKGSTACVYLDGRLVTTADIGDWLTAAKPDTGWLCAGYHHDMSDSSANADRNYFTGTLYNTYLFARALTAAEVESGNINYVDRPIALLNYTEGQQPGGFDALPQSGAGMRFDDGGDHLDLGLAQDLLGGQKAEQANQNGFSVSVRFAADRARATGGENRGSGGWNAPDALVGQRLFSMSLADDSADYDAPNMGFGLAGDGSGSLFYYWAGLGGKDRCLAPVGESLYQGEHYATFSFDPAAETITLYLDGVQVGQTAGVASLPGTQYPAAHAYAGIMEPPDGVNFPAGAGQFYGTIYNLSVKRQPTTLTEHIREARERVTLGAPVAAYDLDAAVNGRVENKGSAGGSAAVCGLGDAGLALDGGSWLEFDVDSDPYPEVATFEVVYSQNAEKSAALIDQQGTQASGLHGTFRYLTAYHRNGPTGYFGYGGGGVYAPSAPAGVKTRLTAVDVSGKGYVYRDGVLIAAGDLESRGGSQNAAFRVGALWDFAKEYCFEGTLYDVKVWATAMSAKQVAGLEPYTADELLAHYDFAGPDPLADKSGRGGHAVLCSEAGHVTSGAFVPQFHNTAANGASLEGAVIGGTASGAVLTQAENTKSIRMQLSYELENVTGNPNFFCVPALGPSELRLEAVGETGLTLWLPATGQGTDNRINISLEGANNSRSNNVDVTVDFEGKTVKGTVNGTAFEKSVPELSAVGYTSTAQMVVGGRYAAGSTANSCQGVLYSLSLWENGALRASYGSAREGDAWTDLSGNDFHVTMKEGVSWVPAPGNVTGQFPEFLGTGGSYAATKTGLVNFDSPFTVRMRFKPLEPQKSHSGDTDSMQNYFSVANDSSAVPFFLLSGESNTPLSLYTSGSGNGTHGSAVLGSIGAAGSYDLELTIDVPNNTYTALCNGVAVDGAIPKNGELNTTNGQIQLAYRNYPDQNAHMVLYGFEAEQNGAVLCRYNGTRSADGSRLIDVSGAGNDAAIHGAVNWVSAPYETGGKVTAVPAGNSLAWVADQLAAAGETVIRVSNSTVQGQVYLHVWVRDKLGNELQRTYGPFDYDTTRPEIGLAARRPKQGETATSGYASITVSDNWQLDPAHTRWAVQEAVSGRVAEPAELFASGASWNEFEALKAPLAATATAAAELKNLGSGKKYYLAVEARDWLSNTATDYLYVDSTTLFDDSAPPAITFTPITGEGQALRAHAVQVDVEDPAENGKTASGVNGQALFYAWAPQDQTPADNAWAPFANHNVLRLETGSGVWVLHVKAADNAGNAAEASTPRTLDNTAPTLAFARQGNGWKNAPVTVQVQPEEAGSGLAALFWARGRQDAGHFAGGAAAEGVQEITNEKAFAADLPGDYTVYARDKAGNERVEVYTESQLDLTPPTLALAPTGAGWTKENITVTVTAADLGGAGVALVAYTLDEGEPQALQLTGGKAGVTLTEPGKHTLEFTVTDGAGNSARAGGTYRIDRQECVLGISPQTTAAQRRHTVQVTVGNTPAGPAASARYGWAQKGAPVPEFWTDAELSGGRFSVTRAEGDGEWTLFVQAAGATGVESAAQADFVFDNTPPTLAAALENGGWAKADALLVQAEPGAAVAVQKDGAAFAAGTGKGSEALRFELTENGVYTITAADAAGNTAAAQVTADHIDKAAPTASLAPAGGEGWHAAPLTVTAAAQDSESGVAAVAYSVQKDGGEPMEQAGGAALEESGEYTVSASVTDRGGNTHTVSGRYRLDLTPPTLAPTASAQSAGSLTLKANAKDEGGSGLARLTGTLAGSPAAVRGDEVVFTGLAANRAYTPILTAADGAGNTAEATAGPAYTLAAPPTGLRQLRATTGGLSVQLTPGENAVAPRYLYTLTQQGQTEPLYKSEEPTREAALQVDYAEALAPSAQLTLAVTAVNEDGEETAPVEFAITGSGGQAALNAPPTIRFTRPAASVTVGAGGSVEFGGEWADPNGDEVTVTVTVGGKQFDAQVTPQGAWSLTLPAGELREGVYGPQDILAAAADPGGERAEARPAQGFTLTLDKTPPQPPVITLVNGGGWQRENGFTLAPATGEAAAELEYSLNGGASWQKYTGETPAEGGPGQLELLARATDAAGNRSAAAEAALWLDAQAPTLAASPEKNESWSAAALTVELTFADETHLAAAGYLVSRQADPPEAPQLRAALTRAQPAAGGKSAEAEVRLTGDGEWYIHALAQDDAGEKAVTFGPYRIDGTPPQPGRAAARAEAQGALTLSGAENAADAGGSGLAQVFYGWQCLDTEAQGESPDGAVRGLAANARCRVWLQAQDGAGNTAQGPAALACTLAADPEKVELTARGADFCEFRITPNSANAVLPEYRLTLKNGAGQVLAQSEWSVATAVRLGLPAGAPETVYAFLTTRSQAGVQNPELPLTQATYPAGGFGQGGALTGNRAPTVTIAPPAQRAAPGVLHAGDVITLTGTASDPDGDDLYISAVLDNMEKSVRLTGDTAAGMPWALSWDVTADKLCAGGWGEFSGVRVTAADPSDNRAQALDPRTWQIDNAGPKAPETISPVPALAKPGPGGYTLRFAPGVDQGAAGVASYAYSLDGAPEVTGAGDTLPPITVSGEGEHTLTARYLDALSNRGGELRLRFALDSTPPDLTAQALYTFNEALAEGWEPAGAGPGPGTWFGARLRADFTFSDGAVAWAVSGSAQRPAALAPAPGLTVQAELGEGVHWVHLLAADEAGNEAYHCFGPYQVDLTPPAVILETDGAQPARSHTARAQVAAPEEALEGVQAEYLWSRASTYSAALTGWQPFEAAEGLETTLTGEDGVWYLYVRAADRAGNLAVERSDGLLLDRTPPELELADTLPDSAGSRTLRFTARDAHSGVAARAWLPGSHAPADFAGEQGAEPSELVTLRENGVYTFYARDEAGNEAVREYTVEGLDTGAPTITAEGPQGVWNTSPFAVTIRFADPEGNLAQVGYVDPQYYDTPAAEGAMPDAAHAQALKTLPDLADLLQAGAKEIDPRYFTILDAADLQDGALTVRIGSGQGSLCYPGSGSLMLHLAAVDRAGNLTVRSFGLYRLDSEPPTLELQGDAILSAVVPAGEAGQENFSGYALRDNLTNVFAHSATGGAPAGLPEEEGWYTARYDPAALDNFTREGLYKNAVTFEITDAAGNTASYTVDCRVKDTLPPHYGDGSKTAGGAGYANYITALTPEDTLYTFVPADFTPAQGPNALFETSLPLRHITLRALPAQGDLLLNGRVLAAADLPQKIPLAEIEAGRLTYRPGRNWYGADTAMAFTACDAAGNETADLSDPTRVLLTVEPVNDPPVLAGSFAPAAITDLESYTLDFEVQDPDSPAASLAVSAVSTGRAACTLLRRPGGGWRLTVTPAPGTGATETITLTARDGEAESLPASFDLTISQAEKAYLALPDSAAPDPATGVVQLDVLANDRPAWPVRQVTGVVVSRAPTHGRVEPTGTPGVFRYTEAQPGAGLPDSFTYTVQLEGAAQPGEALTAAVWLNDAAPPEIQAQQAAQSGWARQGLLEILVKDPGGVARVTVTGPQGEPVAQAGPGGESLKLQLPVTASGRYTVAAADAAGNEATAFVTAAQVDSTPPQVDLGGAVPAEDKIENVTITDSGSGGVRVEVKEPQGAVVTPQPDGGYDITLPPGTDPGDVVLKITDAAGNETEYRFSDLVPPRLEVQGEKPQGEYYLPVTVNFADYTDAASTKEGSVAAIYGCAPENILPQLPSARGQIQLPAVSAPYESGGENKTLYQLEAVDAAGNHTRRTVVMRHIPTPGSVTAENRQEIEDILEEITEELARARPGIDLPPQQLEELEELAQQLRGEIEKQKQEQQRPGGDAEDPAPAGPGAQGQSPADPPTQAPPTQAPPAAGPAGKEILEKALALAEQLKKADVSPEWLPDLKANQERLEQLWELCEQLTAGEKEHLTGPQREALLAYLRGYLQLLGKDPALADALLAATAQASPTPAPTPVPTPAATPAPSPTPAPEGAGAQPGRPLALVNLAFALACLALALLALARRRRRAATCACAALALALLACTQGLAGVGLWDVWTPAQALLFGAACAAFFAGQRQKRG